MMKSKEFAPADLPAEERPLLELGRLFDVLDEAARLIDDGGVAPTETLKCIYRDAIYDAISRLPAPAEERETPVEALNADGEPLHTGDDDRIDLVTGILAALDEFDDPDGAVAEEVIEGIREDCRQLDALLIATIKREREAGQTLDREAAKDLYAEGLQVGMKLGEKISALPAEDRAVTAPPVPPPADARWFPDPPPGPRRAVTAPQEPERPMASECIKGAFEVLYHVGGGGWRYRCQWCGVTAYTHGVEFPHDVGCPTRTLRKQADHLAALTHAIEALRGEMEAKAEQHLQKSMALTARQAHLSSAYEEGQYKATKAWAAILKEWEGRQ